MSELDFNKLDIEGFNALDIENDALAQLAYHSQSLEELFRTVEKEDIILKRTEETAPAGVETLFTRKDFALVRNCEDEFDERDNTEPYINPYGTNVAIRVME